MQYQVPAADVIDYEAVSVRDEKCRKTSSQLFSAITKQKTTLTGGLVPENGHRLLFGVWSFGGTFLIPDRL
jgi:hypothetical protein